MQKNLVIVESPAKAKTLGNFLGNDYKVLSSYGHIRDLQSNKFSIDTDTFQPIYEIPEDKKKIVQSLINEAKKSNNVWLASDEDREGEAISWHLADVLGLDVEKTKRIVFHEITKSAILEAIKNPRSIDMNLVNAQQARRVLDRIVGFKLSPVLWRKVKPGLSAGRVQSVAVRLIVEREHEINEFKATSSYVVVGQFTVKDDKRNEVHVIKAELNKRFDTKEEAKAFLEDCKNAEFAVIDKVKKPMKRTPLPPFMTSTLQQEAARKLGFSVTQTMRIAQTLYEAGHITYMRTDSLNLSSLCINSCKKYITETFGENYSKVRNFQTKAKGAQEAHEAIRPTYMDKETINGTSQELKLYKLIHQRTLASQMEDALFEKTTITINISGKEETFVANGEVMKFDGFMKVYSDKDENEESNILPEISKGWVVNSKSISAIEHFTQRPVRYSEASLVHKMEELGIGRPSTYAPTISTIQQRGYVEKGNKEGQKRSVICLELNSKGIKETTKNETYGADKNKLLPTDTGNVVNEYLLKEFPGIMDYNFTAKVEKDFDAIADGKKNWNKLIKVFYEDIAKDIKVANESKYEHKIGERILGNNPKNGKIISVKIGRFGPMIQEGSSSDKEKPVFAQLLKGQSIETITLQEVLDILELPKTLGLLDGKEVKVNNGRYGPYVMCEKEFVSLPKGMSPIDITFEEAVILLKRKEEYESKRLIKTLEYDTSISVNNGRYGPYLTYKKKNYRLPKKLAEKATDITLEECLDVIEKEDSKKK